MRNHQWGGFWRRGVAFSVDMFIISLLLFFIGYVALRLGFIGYQGFSAGRFQTSYVITSLFMNMLYFTYFHGLTGQTPGKMLLKLRVVREDGKEMDLGTGFLRWIGYLISALVFYLGFIWIAFDSRKQGWHDKIAGTLVTSNKEEGNPS